MLQWKNTCPLELDVYHLFVITLINSNKIFFKFHKYIDRINLNTYLWPQSIFKHSGNQIDHCYTYWESLCMAHHLFLLHLSIYFVPITILLYHRKNGMMAHLFSNSSYLCGRSINSQHKQHCPSGMKYFYSCFMFLNGQEFKHSENVS